MIASANQLALIKGESSADDQTFLTARYADSTDNLFAICSTVVTEGFLALENGLPDVLPDHAISADRAMAQSAFDKLVIWHSGELDYSALTVAIDIDPQEVIRQWKVKAVEQEELNV
jgi:hypothetical protein